MTFYTARGSSVGIGPEDAAGCGGLVGVDLAVAVLHLSALRDLLWMWGGDRFILLAQTPG